eukprot:m.34806 g.34806  ORF g.34806 m.34806 type:complete len:67 (+) comp32024_c0_seq2:110-310(+)
MTCCSSDAACSLDVEELRGSVLEMLRRKAVDDCDVINLSEAAKIDMPFSLLAEFIKMSEDTCHCLC